MQSVKLRLLEFRKNIYAAEDGIFKIISFELMPFIEKEVILKNEFEERAYYYGHLAKAKYFLNLVRKITETIVLIQKHVDRSKLQVDELKPLSTKWRKLIPEHQMRFGDSNYVPWRELMKQYEQVESCLELPLQLGAFDKQGISLRKQYRSLLTKLSNLIVDPWEMKHIGEFELIRWLAPKIARYAGQEDELLSGQMMEELHCGTDGEFFRKKHIERAKNSADTVCMDLLHHLDETTTMLPSAVVDILKQDTTSSQLSSNKAKGRPKQAEYAEHHIFYGKKSAEIPENTAMDKACDMLFSLTEGKPKKDWKVDWDELCEQLEGSTDDLSKERKSKACRRMKNHVDGINTKLAQNDMKSIFHWSKGIITRLY